MTATWVTLVVTLGLIHVMRNLSAPTELLLQLQLHIQLQLQLQLQDLGVPLMIAPLATLVAIAGPHHVI